MQRQFLLFGISAICWLHPNLAEAQADMPMGARAAALANASVTLPDVWALHNNIAGIANLQQPEAGVYVENRFGIQAFTTVALQAAYPTGKFGSYGISLSRFGDELYSQQTLGFGAAHKLGNFSLGAKADLWQVAVAGYGAGKRWRFLWAVRARSSRSCSLALTPTI